jgi:RimJ/RimL family protein N-acetyltransferase
VTPGTPELHTHLLTLEPLTADHASEMVGVLAEGSLYEFTGGGPPTMAELQERYAFQAAGSPRDNEVWHNWVLRETESGAAVGYVQATVQGASADVAWLVGVQSQGRGLAKEAAGAMVAWLRSEGVRTIEAHIHPDHAASAGVAAALGLRSTGEMDDEGEIIWSDPGAASHDVSIGGRK